ncbi:Homeodomain-like domain-containing protein [Nesterenkonia sandarakina]|uniref:Homeodomain-like domain-containing protein n=1 Tax=Nesterenkonia sandarakina TaxID=272918 RepID=A0A2T0YAN5_9MICC|nr:Homeodomain-like domain-containing protein [Nesterenkonia sandarakina]
MRVSAADLAEFEFYTPSRSAGSVLVIDIDRPEAVLDIFDTIPPEIRPSWIVETRKGAQAGWMIDTVDLRSTARERPVAYARAIGAALREALAGDEAVDPLTPVRVRNPTYSRAELRASATPPVYGLKQLHQALKTANLWPEGMRFTGRSATQKAHRTIAAAIDTGNRNQTVFDVARHVAYAGGDFEAVAWETNDSAPEPMKAAEVHGIIRSIARYMASPRGHRAGVAVPSQLRELMAEMGRRGGLANTAAQRAARALGPAASAAARKPRTDTKARKAQKLRAQGHSQAAIGQKLAAAPSTVSRWLRRYVEHQCPRATVEHQVIRRPPHREAHRLQALSPRSRRSGIPCEIPPPGPGSPGDPNSGPPSGPRSG